MARIVVVASVAIDRVWRLDRPLLPGGRLFYESVESRIGGGGFNTGKVLLELGHEVVLVTSLADDGGGRWCRTILDAQGFDTRFVALVPGATVPTEIFVDPTGERTILGRAGPGRSHALSLPPIAADAVYLNIRSMNSAMVGALEGFPWVVSQFPLDEREKRPVDVLVGSRSDLAPETSMALWRDGMAIAGGRLKTIVLTHGPEAVTVVEDGRDMRVPARPLASPGDTTGAGDFFVAGYLDAALAGHDPVKATHLACLAAAKRLDATTCE